MQGRKYTRDKTHSRVWHDAFIRVTWSESVLSRTSLVLENEGRKDTRWYLERRKEGTSGTGTHERRKDTRMKEGHTNEGRTHERWSPTNLNGVDQSARSSSGQVPKARRMIYKTQRSHCERRSAANMLELRRHDKFLWPPSISIKSGQSKWRYKTSSDLQNAHEWVVSIHIWNSHVTRTNESHHTKKWVTSHKRVGDVTQICGSCRTYE